MSTFTKEQLLERAREKVKGLEYALKHPVAFADTLTELEEELELARIALASLEAEPVYQVFSFKRWRDVSEEVFEAEKKDGCQVRVLYTTPPAPVSESEPMKMFGIGSVFKPKILSGDEVDCDSCAHYQPNVCHGEGCPAAMLQGAENAESPTTMKTAPALDSSPKIAESPTGINQGKSEPVTTANKLRDAVETIRNSGIEIDAEKIFAERDTLNTPDCWCRTCRPVTVTDMRFVVCPECGNKRCPHANDHRHACTGSNEPGQEGSAYLAAPQQEVNNDQ
ncbi:hypothetical protein ACQRKP_000590 [Enterobacter hormaechei]